MFDVSKEEVLGGSLTRSLFLISVPIFVQNLVTVLQLVVDLFWLGRFSEPAVAAVGIATPIIGVVSALIVNTPYVGTQTLVSQYYGDDDEETSRRVAFNGLLLALGLGLVGGALGVVGARPLVEFFVSVDPERVGPQVVDLTVVYVQIVAAGTFLGGLSDVVEAAYIGRGDSTYSLVINAVAVGVNLMLTPLLIFDVPVLPFGALGIEGAAIATVVGYTAAFATSVTLVHSRWSDRVVSLRDASVDFGLLREVVDVGLPIAVQNSARQGIHLVLLTLVFAVGGVPGLIAYTIGGRVSRLAAIPLRSLQQATQSVVGQNFGASNYERASKATWTAVGIGVPLMVAFMGVQLAIPRTIAEFFSPTLADESLRLTATNVRIIALSLPAAGALYMFKGGLTGAGASKVTLVSSIVEKWIIRLPLSVVAALYLGADVVVLFWISAASTMVAAVCTAGYYYYYFNASGSVRTTDAPATPSSE